MAKRNYKKGVSTRLLDLCVGSDLEQQRIAEKVESRVEAIVYGKDGNQMGAEEWLKLHKKSLNA